MCNRVPLLFTLLAAILSFTGPITGQQTFKFEKKIKALVQPYLEHKKFQAVSIGVVIDGKTWTGHFGQLAKDQAVPPSNDTLYEIGSISKVLTSLLLADAVENSKSDSDSVKLDQAIGTLLPGLDDENPDVGQKITLKHLSNHVSGLPRMPDNITPADPNDPFAGYDRKLLHQFMKDVTLATPPGEKHEYSNLGAGLLGDLLAAHAKVDYETLLQSRILKPLAMNETSTNVQGDRQSKLAPPFNSALLPDHAWHFDALAGAGSIRSNTNDMLKFIQANLNPPENEIGRAINLAWEKQLPTGAGQFSMGLGWMIAGDGTTRWHNGRTGGYQGMILVNRKLKAGVILLCNTSGSDTDALAEGVFQTVVGMQVTPRKFEKTLVVAAEVIERLVGKYQLAPGVEITIFDNDSRLMAQLTNQGPLQVFPDSDTVWNYHDVEAKLEFELPEQGPAKKVTLFQNGLTMPAPRK